METSKISNQKKSKTKDLNKQESLASYTSFERPYAHSKLPRDLQSEAEYFQLCLAALSAVQHLSRTNSFA